MPRLFTGLEIPALQSASLQLVQGGVPGMRWIELSDFHITLRFIGDVSPSLADDILEAFQRKSDHKLWLAPTIRLSNVSAFGSKKPRSVFAAVEASPELITLQAAQERLLHRLGLELEARRFTPHVTIGRCGAVKPDAIARYLGQLGPLFAQPFQPSRFVLYSAKDSTGGGPYRVEAWWPLQSTVTDEGDAR